MVEKQLSFKEEKISELINTVISKLKEGGFRDAISLLDKALTIDCDYPGIASSLKAAKFWEERIDKYNSMDDPYMKGDYLLTQWHSYTIFSFNMHDMPDEINFSIKNWIFSNALSDFEKIVDDTNRYDSLLLLKIARCYKGIGNYDNSIAILEEANRIDMMNPEVISELADCYAMIDELKIAKVFFREAFFLDPQSIPVTTLESTLIRKLVRKLFEQGFNLDELKEWIPVYGNIWGVFNVKRELKPLELGKLKQSIYLYEKRIENNEQDNTLIPRLINRYLWLIDHYVNTSEEQERINEILRKIKELNSSIFEEIIN